MTAYRMKHVPSGLYYCPSRDVRAKVEGAAASYQLNVKTNLSKRGKVYLSRPTFKWIGDSFYDHRIPRRVTDTRYGGKTSPFIPSDWIVEEVS